MNTPKLPELYALNGTRSSCFPPTTLNPEPNRPSRPRQHPAPDKHPCEKEWPHIPGVFTSLLREKGECRPADGSRQRVPTLPAEEREQTQVLVYRQAIPKPDCGPSTDVSDGWKRPGWRKDCCLDQGVSPPPCQLPSWVSALKVSGGFATWDWLSVRGKSLDKPHAARKLR